MYRLMIVDDEKSVREGIASLTDWESLDVLVVASCVNGAQALDALLDIRPNIIICDVKMPATRRILSSNPAHAHH